MVAVSSAVHKGITAANCLVHTPRRTSQDRYLPFSSLLSQRVCFVPGLAGRLCGKNSVGSLRTACNQSPVPLPVYHTAPTFNECPQGRQVMKEAPFSMPFAASLTSM